MMGVGRWYISRGFGVCVARVGCVLAVSWAWNAMDRAGPGVDSRARSG